MTAADGATLDGYTEAFAALLPTGPAWPRDAEAPVMQLLRALSGVWAGSLHDRSDQLFGVEAFPDITTEMLADWERAAGLPEECYATVDQSMEARRALLVARLTDEGGQSPAYFVELARRLGHPNARIEEFSPMRAGISRAGSHLWRNGAPEQRFGWRMYVGPSSYTWSRSGVMRAGAHPQILVRRAAALECLVERLKPAHTMVRFLYSFPGPQFPVDITWLRAGSEKSRAGRDAQVTINAWGDYTAPGPMEVEYARAGRARAGRDVQAKPVTAVTH